MAPIHRILLLFWAITFAAGSALAAPWQRIDNPPPVIGLDGKRHEATCSAYPGTDPTFRFWARQGRSSNLVVFFEGGGACWDDLSCTFPIVNGLPGAVPQFFVPAIPRSTRPREFVGLFDDSRDDNPVKDWTVVYIPYCTGDIHLGSAERTYKNFGHPIFDLPPEFPIRHRGFDNFMVVLDWMGRKLRTPRQVLVTGSSAGGYGASGNFPWVAKQFPSAKLSVLADASQGVSTAAFDTGTPGRGSWSVQLAPWVWGDDPNAVPGPELLRKGAEAYPAGRFAQYTTNLDDVQVGFYGYMKDFYPPGGACPDPAADWNQQMLATLGSYSATLPNFRYFVEPGTTHTILRFDTYYADSAAGQPFSAWLATMLNLRPGAPPWSSVACPECLTPLPCP